MFYYNLFFLIRMKSKNQLLYDQSLATTRLLRHLNYAIYLVLTVQIQLKRKWNIKAIAKCCFGVSICLTLYYFKDIILGEFITDPWMQQSNNRFSYNICTVSVEERHRRFITKLETSKAKLPRSHIAHPIPERFLLLQQCSTPRGGYSSWENGLVSEIIPGRKAKMCNKLFAGKSLNDEEEKWIDESNNLWRTYKNISHLVSKTSNCTWIQSIFNNNFYVSDREKQFPIAYAINLDKYPHQVLRFLKVIYRPHNLYCLHFDLKSTHVFKHIIFNIASCLDNIIVPRKIENVYRGWYTLVEAHASCFSDLVLARENYPWKYVITLCAKELPLRTNSEIVSLLKPLNGMSSIMLIGPNGGDDYKFRFKWSLSSVTGRISMRDVQMSSPPYNMKVYKSWAYVALSYTFVEYYLCSEVGNDLREYMKDAYIPEENVYAMLFMKPGVPGGYRHEYKDKMFVVMSCIWLESTNHMNLSISNYDLWFNIKRHCSGKKVHDICMVAAQDLAKLAYKPGVSGDIATGGFNGAGGHYKGPDRGPMFHNRYLMDKDVVIMDCMEQELVRRNRLEYKRDC